jgi:hypothetical protein
VPDSNIVVSSVIKARLTVSCAVSWQQQGMWWNGNEDGCLSCSYAASLVVCGLASVCCCNLLCYVSRCWSLQKNSLVTAC